MMEADKFNAVKDATVAIGIANKDTKDVKVVLDRFFIGGEYIVSHTYF
jgi:hypothetical protein